MSGTWLDQLQPASWRGVPFSVKRSEVVTGRKTAIHQYPFRDVVWIEDLGKRGRIFTFQGFLVGDDCYDQEKAMHAQAETEGAGVLVHPTFGSVNVSLIDFSSGQEMEQGRSVTLNFRFAESVESPLFPSLDVSTGDAVDAAADDADDAVASDFADDIADAVQFGSDVVDSIVSVVEGFGAIAISAVNDAGLIAAAVACLIPPAGYTFGRYSSGALQSLSTSITTVAQALAFVTTAQTAVRVTAYYEALASAQAANSATLSAAVQNLVEATSAAAIDPADQVRLLSSMATYSPAVDTTTAPIGAALVTVENATSGLCRRSALTALARSCAAFNPSSSNQAIALRNSVAALFDAEILIAGDANDVATYQALRMLRTMIVLDLNSRAAILPALIEVITPQPTPALTLAYQLYSDASRADDLIARADPINPLFMPVEFVALSS